MVTNVQDAYLWTTGEIIRSQKLTALTLANGERYLAAATTPGIVLEVAYVSPGNYRRQLYMSISKPWGRYLLIQFTPSHAVTLLVYSGKTKGGVLPIAIPALTADVPCRVLLTIPAVRVGLLDTWVLLDYTHDAGGVGIKDVVVTVQDDATIPCGLSLDATGEDTSI